MDNIYSLISHLSCLLINLFFKRIVELGFPFESVALPKNMP